MARRTTLFLRYCLVSIIADALFGMGNDQISYTVAPEYYPAFNFH